MRRAILVSALFAIVSMVCGCAALDMLADSVGAPLPGEDATVAYKAVKWGANLAPAWVGNGVFLLTTLLGAYKARRKGKEFQVVAQSVDRGFRYLDKQKDLVVKAIKAKKYSHAIELLADAEGFNEVIGAFAKGSKLYESIKADVKKAKKKDN